MRLATVMVLALLLLPALAVAGPMEEGKAAYDRQDFQTALKLLQPLADQGNPQAQYQIGKMYFYGQGFARDKSDPTNWLKQQMSGYQEAFKWYKKAADQGYAPAQVEVGELYRVYTGHFLPEGYNVIKQHDDAEAMKWFLKAADQGNPDAEFKIGLLYSFGHPGVPKDISQELKWLGKAAADGQTWAQVNLGEYYRTGSSPDYAESLKWFRMAAERGNAQGQMRLGEMYKDGQGVKQDLVQAYKWYSLGPWKKVALDISAKMTPEQIEEAKNLAAEWKTAHSKSRTSTDPSGNTETK